MKQKIQKIIQRCTNYPRSELTATGAMLCAATLILGNYAGRAQTFQWPVDNVVVAQVHACRGCLSGPTSARYRAGIDMHTGVDVRPSDADPYDYTRPVRAAADGWLERLVDYGAASHGLGPLGRPTECHL